MARNNDVGLSQLENGNWQYRIYINRKGMKKIDTTCRQDDNGNPLKTKKAARDAREAKLYELKNQSKEEKEEKLTIKDYTLAEVYDLYLRTLSVKKAPSTLKKQQSMWDNHIKGQFGDKHLKDISLTELQAYIDRLYLYGDGVNDYSNYSYKYVEGFLKFFYLLFGVAYKSDLIDTAKYTKMFLDRGSRLTMPEITQEDKKKYSNISVYSPKEIKLLDSVFSRGNCYTAFLLGYYGGLRISEVFGIMISDCDVINKQLTVSKQLLYQDGSFCLCPVKTLKSDRVIDIPDILNNHLKNKITEIMFNSRKDSYRNYEVVIDKTNSQHKKIVGGAFLNRKENGELLTSNSIKYWTRVIKEELNINFEFHSLRKTHATMMANANTPVIELMQRLGHKKYDTTMAYYINSNMLSRDILKQNINNLDYSNVVIDELGEDPFL